MKGNDTYTPYEITFRKELEKKTKHYAEVRCHSLLTSKTLNYFTILVEKIMETQYELKSAELIDAVLNEHGKKINFRLDMLLLKNEENHPKLTLKYYLYIDKVYKDTCKGYNEICPSYIQKKIEEKLKSAQKNFRGDNPEKKGYNSFKSYFRMMVANLTKDDIKKTVHYKTAYGDEEITERNMGSLSFSPPEDGFKLLEKYSPIFKKEFEELEWINIKKNKILFQLYIFIWTGTALPEFLLAEKMFDADGLAKVTEDLSVFDEIEDCKQKYQKLYKYEKWLLPNAKKHRSLDTIRRFFSDNRKQLLERVLPARRNKTASENYKQTLNEVLAVLVRIYSKNLKK